MNIFEYLSQNILFFQWTIHSLTSPFLYNYFKKNIYYPFILNSEFYEEYYYGLLSDNYQETDILENKYFDMNCLYNVKDKAQDIEELIETIEKKDSLSILQFVLDLKENEKIILFNYDCQTFFNLYLYEEFILITNNGSVFYLHIEYYPGGEVIHSERDNYYISINIDQINLLKIFLQKDNYQKNHKIFNLLQYFLKSK